ncbi:MAG: hypothetical protein JXA20_15555 [Spirochaetes bacterium]|nr:hypothetical protein [Spirochaetota bacterium]
MKEQYDSESGYCRVLGHHVPFSYCRCVNEGLPCRRIRDCWFERIDVGRFIDDNYTEAEQERIFAPPPEKIASILDLIKKAKGDN